MLTSQLDYHLPPELIAQSPAIERDGSRLFLLDRSTGRFEHHLFRDLPELLIKGDLILLNQSRVIPARIYGRLAGKTTEVELLLVRKLETGKWICMARPGRSLRIGTHVEFAEGINAEIQGILPEGMRVVEFYGAEKMDQVLEKIGNTPLPPYIERKEGELPEDRERYQTIYARHPGSIAAPTAGLHFTEGLLSELEKQGIKSLFITCHVGPGTFRPVVSEKLEEHHMDEEQFSLSSNVARTINTAKMSKRRLLAVGTTSVRTVESCADSNGHIKTRSGKTNLFITPGYQFKAVDMILTNFHLPRSTPLSLAAAFAGVDLLLEAYAEAVKEKYRFYSFGDAMLII